MTSRRLFHPTHLLVHASLPLLLFVSTLAHAGELKEETVKAWNEYLQAEQARMDGRLHGQAPFLWVDAVPERARRVHAGQILVAPADEHTPKHVHAGLVHHWVGATFIPDARLEDVLSIVRNYPRYKDFYKPTVVDSAVITTPASAPGKDEDRFSVRFLNRAVLSKTGLDAEYAARYVQLDSERCYVVGYTTQLREIRNYGEPAQRELPPDEGSGYIWRMYTTTRLVEREGGVYFEVEAIALSRDIPLTVRWIAEPIVRRVSRDALTTSLVQTGQAVRSSMAAERRTVKPAQVIAPVASNSPIPAH